MVLLAVCSAVVVLGSAGCSSIGNAATGPSEAQIKQNENALPPDQQIKLIQSSPMPAAEKAKRIKAIEDKYGVKAGAPANTPGTPAPGG
ncbi:MAG: hypothetical protein ACYC96_11490 [Fimbriimonadaceae bacterium]